MCAVCVCVRVATCVHRVRVHTRIPESSSIELQETVLGCGAGVSCGSHASEENLKESFPVT